MKITPALMVLAFASVAVGAGEPDAKKYTPEIHGLLTNSKQTGPVNVCLRQSGSEIRACGYTDIGGRFFIPSSGPLHSAQAKSDGENADVIPTYWLETGRVDAARKLWPVDPVNDRFTAIELDCDLSRAGRSGDAFRSCDMKTSKALFATVPRDDSPYRMTRTPKPPAK
jgi:hypothetical protein